MMPSPKLIHDSDPYDINSDNQRQKKKPSSYLLFKKIYRQQFLDAHPELTKRELIQKISAAYLDLNQEERDKLQSQYEELIRSRKQSKERLQKRREWTQNNVVKENGGVYNLFRKRHMSKIIKANKLLQTKEVLKRVGEAYRNMSMDEKEKLCDEVQRNATKRRLDQQKKKKTVKKQYSVFALFYKEQSIQIKKKNPTMSPQDTMKKVAKIYRNLGKEEKENIRRRAQALKDVVPKQRKRPQLNFMLFVEEKKPLYLQKFPNKSPQDIIQLIGWEWQVTPGTIKEQYKRESRRRLTEYRLSMRSTSEFQILKNNSNSI